MADMVAETNETPVVESSVKESPVKESSVKESPVKESPAKESPSKELPAKETAVPEIPEQEAKTNGTEETNGSSEAVVVTENGTSDAAEPEVANGKVTEAEDTPTIEPAETKNGDTDAKENGDATDVSSIKRKSSAPEEDANDTPAPEKKSKVVDESVPEEKTEEEVAA